MTRDEHERERRAFWDACYVAMLSTGRYIYTDAIHEAANRHLAERDKRWPAPEETDKAGVDQETEQADNCDTCKFSEASPFREPCCSCRAVSLTTASHWEPIK